MKKWIGITAVTFAALAFADDQPVTKTYELLPAQTLNITNREYHSVEIRAEYPVQIAAGPCHNDYTVQWTCNFDDPSDLFIRDLRVKPVFSTPKANTVTVTASKR